MECDKGLGVGNDGSLVYWSQETIHYSSHHRNYNGISDGGSLEVSAGDVRGGFRSQETSHSSYWNCGVYRCGD